jgi:beta-phosphoglucomutase-like phosphatase (HAD superfamily)
MIKGFLFDLDGVIVDMPFFIFKRGAVLHKN